MSDSRTYFGSCLCGQIKYKVIGELESFFLCHCKFCQKDTGSAYAANVFSTKTTLTWIIGESKVKTYHLPSTRHAKSFCSDCGSAMPNHNQEIGLLAIPAGSLDSELGMKPYAHIFDSSRAIWDRELETIMKFDKFPHE